MHDRTANRVRKPRPRSRGRSLLAFAVLALALPFGVARAGVQEGSISWYGARFHDRPTASGEIFDSKALTMAHPTLPFGTKVRVTNLRNGRSVVVTVNDRGPFVGHRIADLSQAAASVLGMLRRGVAMARIEVIGNGEYAED
ncbi:MAG: septal ring lytic transglycosylase RlpA family protein [Gammaproteobacteria bacterium]|nr:septal ring lytic transglycosylase RlpA family protein [Gammaproteobacteria bacterium]